MQLMKPLYGRRSDLAALLFLESTVPSVSAIMDRSATIDEAVRGTGSLRVFAPAMSFNASRRPVQRFGYQPESAANRIFVAARIDQMEDGPQKSGNLVRLRHKFQKPSNGAALERLKDRPFLPEIPAYT